MGATPLGGIKVCVVGAGAIGGYFGPRLARAGVELSVIARGHTLEVLQAHGWTLESGGERIVVPVHAVADSASLGPQDLVILAVKAYSVASVAAQVPVLIGSQTLVLPALNGVPWWFTQGGGLALPARLASVDPHGVIEQAIPLAAVIGAVIYPSCSSPQPGVSRHASGTRLVFGEVEPAAGTATSPRVTRLVSLLEAAGFDAIASTDIRAELWKKLLGNACFNPVSLLTGSPTDAMIDDTRIHALFVTMMQETIAVGRALGIEVGIEPFDRIAFTRKLGHVKTSMLQDAEAGRPVEIDAILGAVVEIARALGVPAPVCEATYAMARLRAQVGGLLAM